MLYGTPFSIVIISVYDRCVNKNLEDTTLNYSIISTPYGFQFLERDVNMKLAVLSDIHGNHIALKKCIEEIERRNIQKLIFLGDYVGELAYPQKTMAYLRELERKFECYFVRGNKEDYWLEREQDQSVVWKEGDSTTGALLYAYNNLNQADMNFFKALPDKEILSFEGLPDIFACHRCRVNTDNLHQVFEDMDASFILCGHTHLRKEIICDGKVLLNPGAVGIPMESNGRTQFLILAGVQGKWEYEFVDLPYDVEQVIQELHEEDLYAKAPSWTRITEKVLRQGKVCHRIILERAMELLDNETGKCNWPDIPEEYWERAIEELLVS